MRLKTVSVVQVAQHLWPPPPLFDGYGGGRAARCHHHDVVTLGAFRVARPLLLGKFGKLRMGLVFAKAGIDCIVCLPKPQLGPSAWLFDRTHLVEVRVQRLGEVAAAEDDGLIACRLGFFWSLISFNPPKDIWLGGGAGGVS